jgi:hypothetical protein
MRFNSILVAVLLALSFGQVAAADWADALVTDPSLESPVPSIPTMISTRDGGEYYYWIDGTSSTPSSSYITLPKGTWVEVCLIADVDSSTPGNDTLEVQVIYMNGTVWGTPVTDIGTRVLENRTLNGIASAGAGTDCYEPFQGPKMFRIKVTADAATADGLVTAIVLPTPGS